MSETPKVLRIKTPIELDRIILGSFAVSREVNDIAATDDPEALASLYIALKDAVRYKYISKKQAEEFIKPYIMLSTAKYLKKYREIIGTKELWISVPNEVIQKILEKRMHIDIREAKKKLLFGENND